MIRKIQKKFSDNARAKRSALFKEHILPKGSDKIIDLGGGDGKHIFGILGNEKFNNITIADISTDDLTYANKTFGFNTHQLTESKNLPFDKKEFDVVFCNSVIEHVTIPKDQIWSLKNTSEFKKRSLESQKQFADEIRRIGISYFVQTPNKYFILESHTWLPGIIAIIPRPAQIACIKFFNKFWPKKTTPDWNLLTLKEMQALFPDAKIHKEKSLGFTKSFIAVKNRDLG